MDKTSPKPDPTRPPKIQRWKIGMNVVLQFLLAVLILGMLNYLAFQHFRRWDFSRNEKYSLSEKTLQVLQNLPGPVKMFVIYPPAGFQGNFTDIDNLLKEYQYVARPNLTVEFVDTYGDFARTKELQNQYRFGETESLLIFDYNGRSKVVNAMDLFVLDRSMEAFGETPQITAFVGESLVTSAIIEVTEEQRTVIYYLEGQGQPAMTGEESPLHLFRTYLERDNVELKSLNLANEPAVPEDAACLIIGAPRYDLSPMEMEQVEKYWASGGRIFLWLDPAATTARISGFLRKLGVDPQDDRVLRTVSMGAMTGIVKDVYVNFPEGSPITEKLQRINGLFPGETQSLDLSVEKAKEALITLTPLAESVDGYWAETEHQNAEETGVFLNTNERKSPLVVAASVEKGAVEDERLKVNTPRLVIVANPFFLYDDTLVQSNVDFALGSVNWLVSREQLIGISPRIVQNFNLRLTPEQLDKIKYLSMALIPGLAALAGILVWFSRRR